MTVTTLRRLLAPLAAALFALLLAVAGATTASADTVPAPTNPSGFLRVGHLAPDVGPVDVSLTRADGGTANVLTTAPYGAFTPYQTLTPGFYTVAMRPAGARWFGEVVIDEGRLQRVAGTGREQCVGLALVHGDRGREHRLGGRCHRHLEGAAGAGINRSADAHRRGRRRPHAEP